MKLSRPENPGRDSDEVDSVEIENPCDVPWDSMPGDDRIRHCGKCDQNVYNVQSLPRHEAARLMSISGQRVCLRIYRRRDGTVVTADCWSRLRAARRQGVWTFAGVLVIVAWAEVAAIAVGLAGLRKVGARLPKIAPAVESAALRHPVDEELISGLMRPKRPAVPPSNATPQAPSPKTSSTAAPAPRKIQRKRKLGRAEFAVGTFTLGAMKIR